MSVIREFVTMPWTGWVALAIFILLCGLGVWALLSPLTTLPPWAQTPEWQKPSKARRR